MSFYYWNPTFTLDSVEGDILQSNDVRTLYIRYIDVDWAPADSAPGPLAPLIYAISPAGYAIIPVVSIRNRVFEKLTLAAVPLDRPVPPSLQPTDIRAIIHSHSKW
ncbi:MAG TPA: hypothetical protein VKR41_03080, partial [Puia sp.]|nr:hypothetical protein [Puia sp.]